VAFGEHVLNDSNRDAGFQFQKNLVLVSAMVVTFLMLFILSVLQVSNQSNVYFWFG